MFFFDVTKRKNTHANSRPGDSRRRRLPVLALVALALTAALAIAAAPGTAKEPQAHAAAQTVKKTMWGPSYAPDGSNQIPVMKELGVGNFAIQARWDQIAPTTRPLDPTNPNDIAYQWPQYLKDNLDLATANGMQTQILIMGTPSWANGGKSWQWTPDNAADFGDFSTAISRKYPNVHLWMIWGEPNRAPNFQPLTPAPKALKPDATLTKAQQIAPRNYASLVDAAYGALKAESPINKVIGGSTYTSAGKDNIRPYQWIRYMKLPGGGRPRMDMWGHNPWGFSLPAFTKKPSPRGTVQFADLERLITALDKSFKGQRLKLYLAEWGVPTGFKDKDLGYGLKAKVANKWIKAAFKLAKWKRIYTLGWVHLDDTLRNSTGLMTEGGQRKTSFNTYKKIK